MLQSSVVQPSSSPTQAPAPIEPAPAPGNGGPGSNEPRTNAASISKKTKVHIGIGVVLIVALILDYAIGVDSGHGLLSGPGTWRVGVAVNLIMFAAGSYLSIVFIRYMLAPGKSKVVAPTVPGAQPPGAAAKESSLKRIAHLNWQTGLVSFCFVIVSVICAVFAIKDVVAFFQGTVTYSGRCSVSYDIAGHTRVVSYYLKPSGSSRNMHISATDYAELSPTAVNRQSIFNRAVGDYYVSPDYTCTRSVRLTYIRSSSVITRLDIE